MKLKLGEGKEGRKKSWLEVAARCKRSTGANANPSRPPTNPASGQGHSRNNPYA